MWELWHCCVYPGLARIKVHFPDVWLSCDGSYATRHTHTPLLNRFTDENGQCTHHEVCVILTDHRTAIPVPRRVEHHYLKPVPPKKKSDWIVIISGEYQGIVAEVVHQENLN
jgi:hypothetical protein